jgi:hypothetical protein
MNPGQLANGPVGMLLLEAELVVEFGPVVRKVSSSVELPVGTALAPANVIAATAAKSSQPSPSDMTPPSRMVLL